MTSDNGSVSDYGERPAPSVWIQWKGTDVCMDFRCVCDEAFLGHFDGYFAYAVKCPRCGQVYEMQQTLKLYPVESTPFEPVLMQDDSEGL